MNCRYCGSRMDYIGIQDGGGDYGDSVCDEYQCMTCDWIEEDCGGGTGFAYYSEDEDLDAVPDEEG